MLQNSSSGRSLALPAMCPHWWVVLALEWPWHYELELQFISVIWAKKLLKRNFVSGCGACAGCIGQSTPLSPSLSCYVIVCIDFSGSVKNLLQAKLLNSYSGHSAMCEQSGRACQGILHALVWLVNCCCSGRKASSVLGLLPPTPIPAYSNRFCWDMASNCYETSGSSGRTSPSAPSSQSLNSA